MEPGESLFARDGLTRLKELERDEESISDRCTNKTQMPREKERGREQTTKKIGRERERETDTKKLEETNIELRVKGGSLESERG